MNLEQSIRQRWATSEPLATQIPLPRFWTAAAPPDAELPFAVLDVVRIEPRLATSSVRLIQHASLRISVYAETLDAALPIVRDIERRFERSSFALDEGAVLDMRRERLEQRRSDDGVWTVALDYLAVTEHFPLAD